MINHDEGALDRLRSNPSDVIGVLSGIGLLTGGISKYGGVIGP
jgi:hypothetical protein